jgi:hypothetical protein
MNYLDKCVRAMAGPSHGFLAAWNMATASYSYTRSCDGIVINDAGDTISFSRWYAFKGAVEIFFEYLRRDGDSTP